MNARMYRLEGGSVVIADTVIFQLPDKARPAAPASSGYFRLGDDTGPLALIGTADGIVRWLDANAGSGIENASDIEQYEMDDVQVTVAPSQYTDEPASAGDVPSLNPIGDGMAAVIKGVTSLAPQPPLVEVLSGVFEAAAGVKKPAKPRRRRPPDDQLQVVFTLAHDRSGTATAVATNVPGGRTILAVPFAALRPAIMTAMQDLASRRRAAV